MQIPILFTLQLYSVLSHSLELEALGLSPGQELLTRLKDKVVTLASGPVVVPSVQASAQSALQMGWSLLLPTADERARALSTLLPISASGMLKGYSCHKIQLELFFFIFLYRYWRGTDTWTSVHD
jgi:hypothetical protein